MSLSSRLTNSRSDTESGATRLRATRGHPGGRCSETGPLTTLSSLSLPPPVLARTLSYGSSCENSPQKRLNVRGSLTAGLIRTTTFFEVVT